MFKHFLTALTQRIVVFLTSHKNFFELNENERKTKMEELTVPGSFKAYLLEINDEEFMKDIKLIFRYINEPAKTNVKESIFFNFFACFLSFELAKKIDYLNGDFYLMPTEKRKEAVNKLIKSDSILARTLKDILSNYTYQQIVSNIYEINAKVSTVAYLVVQSPREMNTELKKEIRENLSEKHPLSIPVFQISKKLIGGIRIFQDGQSIDRSWLQRVLHFTSLTSR